MSPTDLWCTPDKCVLRKLQKVMTLWYMEGFAQFLTVRVEMVLRYSHATFEKDWRIAKGSHPSFPGWQICC